MTAVPCRSPIQALLESLHARYAECRDGAVASYIPELAKADPDLFGICVATADGFIYDAGAARHEFTIQSISKPFVYGLALDDHGSGHMLTKVGVEPSGDAFNAISLHRTTGRPLNPMINAGAIATTGQVAAATPDERLARILGMFARYTGRPMRVDREVYQSESRTGHRNRAIGHLLRNFDVLEDEPMAAVDVYFQQCAISMRCVDLAMMGATLANQGVNPVTGERAIEDTHVENVLSVMASCGMYDFSGGWIYNVGMPAKSGVAGGVRTVILDFHHVTAVNGPASRLLAELAADLGRSGTAMFFTHTHRLPTLREQVAASLTDAAAVDGVFRFPSTDQALEWCEDELLRGIMPGMPAAIADLHAFEIAAGLAADELEVLGRLIVRRAYAPGDVVIREGDGATHLFLVIKGLVGVWLGEPGKGSRVASFSAGAMVGELAFIDGAQRVASVVAEGVVECGMFAAEDFLGLQESHPRIHSTVLRNIAASLATKLRRANHHVLVLSAQMQ